jgi:hypothetical protein
MSFEEMQLELVQEKELADRALRERAEAVLIMEALADASRCLAESFRMTLKAHNLDMSGHQKAFARYNKARRLYETFCVDANNQ